MQNQTPTNHSNGGHIPPHIQATIELYLKNSLRAEAAALEKKYKQDKKLPDKESVLPVEEWLNKFITQHPDMLKLKKHVRILAPLDDTVLITGESGTGKEIIARALHGARGGKFVAINCAGLPETLLESELFGHEAGAFTGAIKPKSGLFKEAQNGTIFLDEIGELPITLQAKFLRVLQERTVRKVGGNREEPINCRVIAATHRNLSEKITGKEFRLDLYHRLSTFQLNTIPLRDRIEDIPLIVKALDYENKFPSNYDWQKYITNDMMNGNVRQVQAIVKRFLVLGELPKVI